MILAVFFSSGVTWIADGPKEHLLLRVLPHFKLGLRNQRATQSREMGTEFGPMTCTIANPVCVVKAKQSKKCW
jgi:hypothetical protein